MSKHIKLKQQYFFCYSKGLKNWISNNQVSHITKAKAISNDKEFWLYEQSEELSELVAEYEKNKVEIRNRGYRPA